ncbi:PilW family protein [Acinetobacter johnsonii]|uniref:PilW family protein n=1 Tax=Acinetobacter johnsonii TaxID=40214 RepID=UPI002578570E|nr:PilW family protein [Acinetobacter johnsonii]MDM1249738.1 PilW family protein [Acinetobacter johnsonii]
MKKQAGFTLIELMISIGLGLIIVASALMLFLSGQRNVAMQKSAADLQDDQNFGLNYIAKNIRNANLNSPSASLNNASQFSGIVFSKANLSSSLTGLPTDFNTKFITANISTHTSNMRSKINTTYTDAVNDQLVIQYRPTQAGGYDCEGNLINSSYVVERYFVRTDANGGGTAAERSALACAASQYESSDTDLEAVATDGIYGSGQIIMKRVDLFRVRFLVDGKRYMTVAEYNTSVAKPRILAVQLGIIARAPDGSGERSISTTQEFSLLGQTFTQKTTFPNRYLRTPIMQTVALRNALGDRS